MGFCMRRMGGGSGGVMGIGKNKARVYAQKRPALRFKDVASQDGAESPFRKW